MSIYSESALILVFGREGLPGYSIFNCAHFMNEQSAILSASSFLCQLLSNRDSEITLCRGYQESAVKIECLRIVRRHLIQRREDKSQPQHTQDHQYQPYYRYK